MDEHLDKLVRTLNLMVVDLEYGDIDVEEAVIRLTKLTDELGE